MKAGKWIALGGLAALAACAPRAPQPQPQPPQPQVPQAQRPLPVPPPPMRDWRDIPVTAGGWIYRSGGAGSQALFGVPNSEAQFVVRCDRARRQVILQREGTPSAAVMTVRTTSTARSLPVSIQREPMAYASAALSANDPLLDHMAFSRGRYTIEAPGLPMLVLPSWPEPARVVEDCRG